jgi:hypothetical protein
MAVFSSIAQGRSEESWVSISVAGGVGVTLTIDQSIPRRIELTGAVTAAIDVTVPVVTGEKGVAWTFKNSTTGGNTITVKPATGTGIAIAAGKQAGILYDGTNFIALENDFAAAGVASSGANTNITSLAGITGGIVATGSLHIDELRGNNAANSPLTFERLVKALPSDANYTLLNTEYTSPWLEITGAITVQRDIVMPLTAGAIWEVFNNTTGGFGLRFIGATGTGIVVAAGKRARVAADGTNIVRMTADNP